MRVTYLINNTLVGLARQQEARDRMRRFTRNNFMGGWEIWLQCELGYRMPNSNAYDIYRETQYPNGQKCDFKAVPTNQVNNNIDLWLEIKVLLRDETVDLVSRFCGDLNKVYNLNLPSQTNSIGAVAVVPRHAPDIWGNAERAKFLQKSPVDPDRIIISAVNGDYFSGSSRYSQTKPQYVGDDTILIMSFILI